MIGFKCSWYHSMLRSTRCGFSCIALISIPFSIISEILCSMVCAMDEFWNTEERCLARKSRRTDESVEPISHPESSCPTRTCLQSESSAHLRGCNTRSTSSISATPSLKSFNTAFRLFASLSRVLFRPRNPSSQMFSSISTCPSMMLLIVVGVPVCGVRDYYLRVHKRYSRENTTYTPNSSGLYCSVQFLDKSFVGLEDRCTTTHFLVMIVENVSRRRWRLWSSRALGTCVRALVFECWFCDGFSCTV